MGVYKKWEIHNLNSINLQGEDDVTRSVDTFLNIFIILWATTLTTSFKIFFMPIFLFLIIVITIAWYFYNRSSSKNPCFSKYIVTILIKNPKSTIKNFLDKLCSPSMKEEFRQVTTFTKISLILITILSTIETINIVFNFLGSRFYMLEITILSVISFYSLWHLLFNRNFILYDMLYKFRLKIKLITIEEKLSPFSPLIEEFEKIILGLNRNNKSGKEESFDDSLIFFWIRKDRDRSRERSINQFIPYLSLITILFVLKEKSYKFVAIIGTYFSLVGLLFIIFYTFMVEKLKDLHMLEDSASISVLTMTLLVLWYLFTIYSIYDLIDISKYLKHVNKTARRAKIKKDFNFTKGYRAILDTFDRDNAVYIYDYTFDKYQQVDGGFLAKNLNSSKRLVDKNIAALVTIIISMVLVVFVEITANGIFIK